MEGDFSAGTQLSEEECQQRMKELPLWELAPDSRSMSRTFVAESFAEDPVLSGALRTLICHLFHLRSVQAPCLRFFNQIAELADVESGHHPDLHLTDSRTVTLVLFTDAVKGLTIEDFNLARQIDEHTVLYSSKWLKGNPRIIEILVQNQGKDAVSDITRSFATPDRKTMSGIGELLQGRQDAQGVPSVQSELQGDYPVLQVLDEEEVVDTLEFEWPQKLLSDSDLEARLRLLSSWKLSPDRRSISRTFQARHFSEGIKFFNEVARLAEEEGHPPDLHLTDFRKVTVVLMTQRLQGLTSLDIVMAERINNIDVEYSEPVKGNDNSLHGSDLERSPSQNAGVSPPEDSSQWPVLEVQPPKNSSQQPFSCPPNLQANLRTSEPPKLLQSRNISSADGDQGADQDSATLLHSLILVYADAGAKGLSIHEAVRKMKKYGLPGLKERAKTVQVAKITNNHPNFVACEGIGCFALRKSLVKSFQRGALDVEEYAEEKKMETAVLERYASKSKKTVSMVQLPLPSPFPPVRVATAPASQQNFPSFMSNFPITRRNPLSLRHQDTDKPAPTVSTKSF